MEVTATNHIEFAEVPRPMATIPTVSTVTQGRLLTPQQHIITFSPEEWEEFINEWAHHQKTNYKQVVRFSGAGDMGIDVAAFTDKDAHHGVWDCFQCKHYPKPLMPGTAFPEIGKILWYSFSKEYSAPRKYYFMAPWDIGKSLKTLLLAPDELKQRLIENWDKDCAAEISAKQTIKLEGDFDDYVSGFDFSIFTFKTRLEVIDEHKLSPYAVHRFGGGLPPRPDPAPHPAAIAPVESRYVQQLYDVYSEETNTTITDITKLGQHGKLLAHLDRQRECFYSAEALRNFARDTVPEGTFEDLQNEVFTGVVDVEQSAHSSSMVRLNAVTSAATVLQITSNGLITATKINDRKGICHQLANGDRLIWKQA